MPLIHRPDSIKSGKAEYTIVNNRRCDNSGLDFKFAEQERCIGNLKVALRESERMKCRGRLHDRQVKRPVELLACRDHRMIDRHRRFKSVAVFRSMEVCAPPPDRDFFFLVFRS